MNIHKEPCPFCNQVELVEKNRDREIEFEGSIAVVKGLLYSVCGSCAMEMVTPSQTRLNKRTIIDAQKSTQGLLNGHEILSLRKQLGITQLEAAKLFGGGVNAFSKYETNAITQTKAMDNILRLVRDVPSAAEYLAKREHIQLRSITQHIPNYVVFTVGGRNKERIVKSYGSGNYYEASKADVRNVQITKGDVIDVAAVHAYSVEFSNVAKYEVLEQ
jgi:HTH-type transcriptional regulator/antitoxin MqsA